MDKLIFFKHTTFKGLKIIINNFILIPSAIILFMLYQENIVPKEIIINYFIPLGMLSLTLNIGIKFVLKYIKE